METTTLITLTWELHTQGLSKSCIAERLGKDRGTIRLWIEAVREQALLPFFGAASQGQEAAAPGPPGPHVYQATHLGHPRARAGMLWADPNKTLRSPTSWSKTIQINISVSKVYEVLAEKYVLRSKGRKNQKRGGVPKATASRQVLQMDTVHFGQVYAFTAVDIFSREARALLG